MRADLRAGHGVSTRALSRQCEGFARGVGVEPTCGVPIEQHTLSDTPHPPAPLSKLHDAVLSAPAPLGGDTLAELEGMPCYALTALLYLKNALAVLLLCSCPYPFAGSHASLQPSHRPSHNCTGPSSSCRACPRTAGCRTTGPCRPQGASWAVAIASSSGRRTCGARRVEWTVRNRDVVSGGLQ